MWGGDLQGNDVAHGRHVSRCTMHASITCMRLLRIYTHEAIFGASEFQFRWGLWLPAVSLVRIRDLGGFVGLGGLRGSRGRGFGGLLCISS